MLQIRIESLFFLDQSQTIGGLAGVGQAVKLSILMKITVLFDSRAGYNILIHDFQVKQIDIRFQGV